MKVFLDTCVLVRLSTKGETAPLFYLAMQDGDFTLVTSAYSLQEAFRTIADPGWPPKSALAFLVNVGQLIFAGRLDVMLEDVPIRWDDPTLPVCSDPGDVPIILAAQAKECDVLVSDDKAVLGAKSPVRCVRVSDLVSELQGRIQVLNEAMPGFGSDAAASKEPQGE